MAMAGLGISPELTSLIFNANEWNPYVYVMNSPVGYRDPWGMFVLDPNVDWANVAPQMLQLKDVMKKQLKKMICESADSPIERALANVYLHYVEDEETMISVKYQIPSRMMETFDASRIDVNPYWISARKPDLHKISSIMIHELTHVRQLIKWPIASQSELLKPYHKRWTESEAFEIQNWYSKYKMR